MEEQLREVFARELGIAVGEVQDTLRYAEHPAWDSVAHMALIAGIEQAFGIMIDADDVIAMDSFAAARQIVSRHL
jgi:acyl carrier protein